MSPIRKKHGSRFKAKVALEAARNEETLSQVGRRYSIHPIQVGKWRKELVERAHELFTDGRSRPGDREFSEEKVQELYEQIGRLKVENDFLKKNLDLSVEEKRAAIEIGHPVLSLSEQCRLLDLPRSTYYYEPAAESVENLWLMRRMDELHTAHPFFGSRQLCATLCREGHVVNRKRVQRLMRLMGLEATYCRPRTTVFDPSHRVFPYLLRNVAIERVHQAWGIDITYIRMRHGFLYLVAILDWYSRYVLAWELSNSMAVEFCLEVLNRALKLGLPEICNSDQGAQFTSYEFTEALLSRGIRVSMDGKGRALDNVFVERLWRSVKYEEVYLHDYATGRDALRGLDKYFRFYNHVRPHQALARRTPVEVFEQA